MNPIKVALPSLLLCLFFPPLTLGNQLQLTNEFIDLPLEELMQVKVVTASKTINTLSNAPGVMSVVTAEEIARFGANNLFEVLERVTSVYMTGSYMYPQATLAMRGDLITHHDNHILILINSRPTRETMFGGYSSSIYLSFPISMIDRLEIIRGPGSALYGTNAYTGVINIITKEDGDSSIAVTGGSLQTQALEAKTAFGKGDFKGGGAVKTFKEDGWNFHAVDEAGRAGETQYGKENYGAFGFGNYNNLKVNALLAKTQQDNWGNRTLWEAVPNAIDAERKFLDLGLTTITNFTRIRLDLLGKANVISS